MKRIVGACFSSLVLVVMAYAAVPAARVSSAEPFMLRGAVVPVAGVPSWPLLAGDSIGTEDASASIRFADGSVVTLGERSNAQLEEVNGKVALRLVGGSMEVTRAAGSTVLFLAKERLVEARVGKPTTTTLKPLLKNPPPPPPPGLPPPPPPVSRR